jgi:hypothetical protein
VHVDAGATAPFEGQLVSTDLALALGIGLQTCRERAESDVRYERSVCRVQLDGAARKAELERSAAAGRLTSCETALHEEAERADRPWWEAPSFTIPASFIAGALVVGATAVGVTVLVLRAK